MRLTDMTDIAFRTLIFAGSHPDRIIKVEEVVTFYNLPHGTVKKVATNLTQAGILVAQRGRSGGLRLAHAPEQINLGTVTRAIEPDFGLVECMRPQNKCVITGTCRLKSPLIEAQSAFLAVLDRYTLADILLSPLDFGLKNTDDLLP
ncbi:transcriptional regulator, BadM/Rrf2 family [Epibacterium ulvae]|uniref:Transcriptional regulator, BadM/Rrf2 family n=1 Tax=Epibacterium ulvae TaxID=1156985 RepID=A0A1G5PNP2_9RHOB|nr:Rrf2 family transcriptional regulator [Epibacterium ulvae]SCZ51195.1 transcriptional regulator, BadM/Rrf2 family [Epibacterium ulvae]